LGVVKKSSPQGPARGTGGPDVYRDGGDPGNNCVRSKWHPSEGPRSHWFRLQKQVCLSKNQSRSAAAPDRGTKRKGFVFSLGEKERGNLRGNFAQVIGFFPKKVPENEGRDRVEEKKEVWGERGGKGVPRRAVFFEQLNWRGNGGQGNNGWARGYNS